MNKVHMMTNEGTVIHNRSLSGGMHSFTETITFLPHQKVMYSNRRDRQADDVDAEGAALASEGCLLGWARCEP